MRQWLGAIDKSIPDIHPLWKRLVDRTTGGFLAPESAQHLHLAGVCLHDLADTIQISRRALFRARHEWLRLTVHREKPEIQWAIHHSRFYFDYAAIALAAASNHLASAMWHIEEKTDRPLGREYKTAASARNAWKKQQKTSPPRFLAILDTLLDKEPWKVITCYRDQWVHRGLPVIAGEVRLKRRQIWQDAKEPPPETPWMMKRETGAGRVSYFVQGDVPQFQMPELLDTGAAALVCLVAAVEDFLPLFDAAYGPYGVTFNQEK